MRRWWREQGEGRGGEGRGTSVGMGSVLSLAGVLSALHREISQIEG